MTLKQFFTGRTIAFLLLLIIGLGFFAYDAYFSSTKITEVNQPSTQNTEPPVFTWKYEKANTINLDGIPETDVYLEAKYPNGSVVRKLIATTPSMQ